MFFRSRVERLTTGALSVIVFSICSVSMISGCGEFELEASSVSDVLVCCFDCSASTMFGFINGLFSMWIFSSMSTRIILTESQPNMILMA